MFYLFLVKYAKSSLIIHIILRYCNMATSTAKIVSITCDTIESKIPCLENIWLCFRYCIKVTVWWIFYINNNIIIYNPIPTQYHLNSSFSLYWNNNKISFFQISLSKNCIKGTQILDLQNRFWKYVLEAILIHLFW